MGLSLLAVKTVCEFEEKLECLQRLYLRMVRIFQREMELSETREGGQYSTESALTPVRSEGKCCPRGLFDQHS